MNEKKLGRLLAGWLRSVRSAALTGLLVPAAFVLMHLLGQGNVRELGYTLLLVAFGLGYAGIRSFTRYTGRQLRLWEAMEHLPPDAEALPEADGPAEENFRELSVAYQQARNRDIASAAAAERERLDYFTLWVHQIKTPIAALDLMAQSDEPIDRELLRQEVFKIGQYADAALNFQRLQSLHNDLALTDVPLYPLCCTVVKRLRPIFLYRKISLRMEPFEGSTLSDPKWLGMALMQVMTNALKYTPEGGEITVALAGPQVLTVRDTGVGIRAEDLPRVFDRGFTGHIGRTGREQEKSTGIGLYLCKQACDKLGHQVSIASPPEGGVTVTFDLRRERFEVFS
ncbi:MAG TPA: sensor histidine kinase [Candidatus Limiplasma sp.]|nr:sensor histidine kinase [Candidatus Limiplasma sp.]HPS81875.1 sensor histidine kinase [Candidatus Limiplasma sp.]